jgi:hypothetical protein
MGKIQTVKDTTGTRFKRFVFSNDDLERLKYELKVRHQLDEKAKTAFINDLALACAEAFSRKPNRSNRKRRLENFLNQMDVIQQSMGELQDFCSDNLNYSKDIYKSATLLKIQAQKLESMLDSAKTFCKFKPGAIAGKQADVARGVKTAFENAGLPLSESGDSLFTAILSICLSACEKCKLKSKTPRRTIHKTLQK